MSSFLSAWFYLFAMGIGVLMLITIVFIFYSPSRFMNLTTSGGEAVDLTSANAYDATTPAQVAATAQNAVIKIGSNAYSIANNTVSTLPNPFVVVLPSTGKSGADALASATVTGTLLFWLLLFSVSAVSLIFVFIAVRYPELLFSTEVGALIRCLPKKARPASCTTKAPIIKPIIPVKPPAPPPPPPPKPAPPPPKPVAPPPIPAAQQPAATAPFAFTPAQLAVFQQLAAALSAAQPKTT